MKSKKLVLGLCLLLLTAISLHAADPEYQTGKIVAVEKLESSSTGGGTDAPSAPNQNRFNLSIQIGDSIYVCRVKTTSDMDLDWAINKEVQARKEGGVVYVKRSNGKVVKFSIVSRGKPE